MNWRKRFDQARELAGLNGENWPDNALRHGFASYHAAHFQEAGKLAAEMGHTTPGIVFQYYRGTGRARRGCKVLEHPVRPRAARGGGASRLLAAVDEPTL